MEAGDIFAGGGVVAEGWLAGESCADGGPVRECACFEVGVGKQNHSGKRGLNGEGCDSQDDGFQDGFHQLMRREGNFEEVGNLP